MYSFGRILLFLLFNYGTYLLITNLSELYACPLYFFAWYLISAMETLKFSEGLIALFCLGLFIDSSSQNIPFGLSSCLFLSFFITLKPNSLHNTFFHYPKRWLFCLNGIVHIFFLIGIILIKKLPCLVLFQSWPSVLISACLVFIFYSPLRYLQKLLFQKCFHI